MKPAKKPKAEVFDLQAVADAIDDGDGTVALDAALVAWRQTHAPALADLIDVISTRIAGAPVENDTEFGAVARDKAAADVGRLLPAVPELPASSLPSAGAALAAFAADPRIATAIATWALDPPTTSSSTYPFWTKLLDYLGKSGDTRALAIVKQRLKKKQGDSQFWPKFYKALEKAAAKLAETNVVTVDAKLIAKLAKAAAKLEVEAPVKRSATKQTTPKVDGTSIEQAVKHLEAGRVQSAIDAMVVAWKELDRSPHVAAAIDRATRLLPSWDRALGGTDKAIVAAWDASFGEDPQAAMPQLLHDVAVGGAAVAEKHLVELASLPDDPRIALRLAELCAGHTASPQRTQFWKSLLDLLARIRDPRVAPSLCVSFRNFEGTYYNHHRQARRIIGDWAQNPPVPAQLGPKDVAAIKTIDRQLATLEAERDTTERDLLNAIVDAWDDNGPRLVYADWLTDRQHPRGEMIVLACKDKLTDAETKRLQQLRKIGSLYGPLDDLARWWNDDLYLGLDRGLPTKLHNEWSTSPLVWYRLAGYPLLSTIETIEFDSDERNTAPHDDFARVLLDPRTRRLKRVVRIPKDLAKKVVDQAAGRWKAEDSDLVRA